MVNNFVPNGLLLSGDETFVPKVFNINRWLQVEDRTTELLGCIQPNHKSEILRNNVVSYIKGLIKNHVPCQVFQFGSVPLKTYLPDGDIDLTIFGIDEALPETLISEIQQKLQNEINNELAEFKVKEVQFIQAEVKIIKCLIEDFVIDISFNKLSGLSSLCFFEEVDNLIGKNHIFKQSIILVKAWCYYESRLLGSNSGLFSTYALKVLVLYIFNLYGNGFAGPLEVLFRFLEFYSKFDWKNYCISLSGPVPLSSLPADMTAESPRKDCQSQDLLLTKWFLGACMFYYGHMPCSQENQVRQFVSKHINIIDPLRLDNNLGRSISKASFFRIKSAFGLGAKRMVRLLNCTEEYLIAEFDFFFKNTWDRHGNGYWIHVSIYNRYIRKVGKLTWQESEDEQAQASNKSRAIHQKPDNQLKESNQMFRASNACVVSETQSSSPESAPIYSEAQNQHCNVFVSETESELVHFSSSMSDSMMGSSSRSEFLDNLSFRLTSCDLRSEDAVKSKNPSNMGLHKEEPDCATITESSRTLHALMDHSVDKEEHGGVGNITGSSRSYLEAVKGAKSNRNEAMRQQEEEHHFVSTAENCKTLKYLDALLGMKKSHASFSPPSQQNMSYSVDKVQFPKLKPPFPTVRRSINVGEDSVDAPAVVIKHGNVMNLEQSCKYTPASDSTSETNLSSLPPETTQPENVHDQSTVNTDIVRHESTTSESVALNVHAPFQVQQVQFPEQKPPFPTVKRPINVGKDSVDPPAVLIKHGNVMNPAESCIYTPASDSTSETNPSSLTPETSQPENVHGQSTVSTDIVRHESTTSESVALNVHALQSPCAPGSSVLQFPFKFDNISHVEASNYLLNRCFDILYGDFESYWANLKYGQHCVNGHSEEPVYFPPAVELPMDFQAQYYWNARPSGSVNNVPLVVPGMPPTFTSDSHIEGINQGVSFWLPGSSGSLGTFMPNPFTYHEKRHYAEDFYNKHQNANNISVRQEDLNFNSRGRSSISNYRQPRNFNSNSRKRFSRRGQNHYRRNEISEGMKEVPHQGEGKGPSSAVNEIKGKKESPHQGEGSDNSPYQP